MKVHQFFLLAPLLGGVIAFAAPASAAVIKAQAPCTTAPCVTFDGGGVIPTSLRNFVFNAPGAGTAAVSFTGTMFCVAGGTSASQRVADFVTQIVPAAATVPDLSGPSALRIAMRIGAPGPDLFGLSTTVNLATTRVFPIAGAGNKRYFMNLSTLRLDPSVQCSVYDGAFTVVFVP